MSAFKHNLKLIRSLTKKTQKEFAELIKSNESNIKTWENKKKKTLPVDAMIYETIAEIAGISVEMLTTQTLGRNEININVEKVDKDDNKYIQLLESNDRFFKGEFSKITSSLEKLIGLGMKQEALIKLNLQHMGIVEALQKGENVDDIQAQINNQISEIGPYEQKDNDDDK